MLNRKFTLRILTILLLSWSIQIGAHTQAKESLNEVMTKIGHVMVELFPLIFTDKTLSTRQNQKIYRLTNQLQTLFESAEPHILKKSPTYHLSYQLLSDYLNAIVDKNNLSSLTQVKSRLSTLSDFCISCHTQDNKLRTLFSAIQDNNFNNSLARAEFNYATRNYGKAHEHYVKHLIFNPKLNDSEVLNGLFKILSIYTQILNQPVKALEAMNQLEKEKTFSPEVIKFIKESKRALTELQATTANEKKLLSFSEIEKYITLYLGGVNARQGIIFSTPEEEIQRLWLRGQLFRYLNNNPKPDEIPHLLYWLALCDRSLGHGYDYTLADFYIKECITRYSAHPMAQHCFNEHKDYLKFYYTTPTEPILPFEVNEELKKLERYLKKH